MDGAIEEPQIGLLSPLSLMALGFMMFLLHLGH